MRCLDPVKFSLIALMVDHQMLQSDWQSSIFRNISDTLMCPLIEIPVNIQKTQESP